MTEFNDPNGDGDGEGPPKEGETRKPTILTMIVVTLIAAGAAIKIWIETVLRSLYDKLTR